MASLDPVAIRTLILSNDISEVKAKALEFRSAERLKDLETLPPAQQQQITKVQVVLWNRVLQLQQNQRHRNQDLTEASSSASPSASIDDLDIIESHQAIARCWMDLGQYEKAITELATALELQADSLSSLQLVGQALVSIGDFDQALRAQQRILYLQQQNNLDTTRAQIQIAAVHEAKGEFDTAIATLKEAENAILASDDIAPPDRETQALLYEELGKLYNIKGDYELAAAALSQSHEIWIEVKGENHPQTQQVAYLLEMASSLVD